MREIFYEASEEIRVKFNDSKTLPEVPTIIFRRILNFKQKMKHFIKNDIESK